MIYNYRNEGRIIMLERKITKQLIEWKNSNNKMSLVVKGARQVGKTYIIKKFCEENYENFIHINFDESPEYNDIFNRNLDVETIIKRITATVENVNLVPYKTVIFLDEIQNCPNARTALKFLTLDDRFDVIASRFIAWNKCKESTIFPSRTR